ncbi:MAG: Arginine--tRNA ligase [SAR92 bacterium MED-G29]|jgi:arginyl-tRNA synthetase|nr:MAG: Arginine--tRNA ligase [SAR92 bacterium MED-G29]|tara:strand:- start:663 stop:2384 length:1722 start_codon:yes stop_codon:yes gene_type:complete
MGIKDILIERIAAAMQAAGIPSDCSPMLALSGKSQFGDYQANGAMGAAKQMKTNPRELAQKILDKLDLDDIAEKVEIAGPGFINISLNKHFLAGQLTAKSEQITAKPQTVVIDYSSPNLAKEMHVGHLRSTIIGDALARLLEYQGHSVIRQNHMGDWGTQFGMLIAELELHLGEGDQANLALNDLEVFYQQSKKHFDADPEFADKARAYVVKLQSGDAHCRKLWQKFIDVSVAHNLEIYKQLNVGLRKEHIAAESSYNDDLGNVLSSLLEQGIAVDSEGAKVVFLNELADKNGEPSPMIVQKSGGGFLYASSDLACLRHRVGTLQADRILYFIDARQSLHMKQVFITGRKASFVPPTVSLEHHPFGTMMGADGRPFKTRSGGTVKLADLLVEAVERAEKLVREKNPDLDDSEIKLIARKVGIGAIKYADLSKTRTNDYIFDWNAMLSFEGNTSPYLQYAYTRIRSIFRKAGIEAEGFSAPVSIEQAQEKALALKLLQFNEVLDQVAADCYPHILCTYLYELASAFMSFYEQCPVLKDGVDSATQQSRLQLCALSATTLAQGLDLLGIEVMEKM